MNDNVAKQREFWQGLIALLGIIGPLLLYFFLPDTMTEPAKRVAAILLFALFFWGFDVIPLYATSVTIVLLLTLLLTSPFDWLGLGPRAISFFFAPFASPIIMLFLGGLVLAAAAQKHGVDRFFIEKILAAIGNHSAHVLFALLLISGFFSMWISNTAAAAMMLMIIQPIIKSMRKEDPLRKGFAFAIAFGANIGGIGTPIGTPPNAIALGILQEYGVDIDFLEWMVLAVPLAFLLLMITGGLLLLFFPPMTDKIVFHFSNHKELTSQGKGVLGIALLMILLWLTQSYHHLPESLVSLFGVALFAATQLITVQEFRSIPWDVLVLMWGGLALGEAVQASGLTDVIVGHPVFAYQGVPLILAFCGLAVLLTSLISNTATANLLLPLALSIDTGNKTLLSITVALACSFSFAFPLSTPPNALAYATGLFSVKEMFRVGATISVVAIFVTLLGFSYIIPWVVGR